MPAPSSKSLRSPDRVIASPRARRAMRRLQVAPGSVRGSGPGGRIVEADVRAATVPAAAAVSEMGPSAGLAAAPSVATAHGAGLSVMRRAIAEKTALSFSTVPHFYLRTEVDVTPLMELRHQLLSVIQREVGAKLTLTDFLLRALARALAGFPNANSIWQNGSIIALPTVDIGLVVGLPDGLLIPVLRNVDQLTLAQVVKQRSDLVAAARAGQVSAEAAQGGAMSLSNLGAGAVDEFFPVIAPPQSGMLAAGRAAARPFVVEGKLAVRTTLRLCLAVDHRVLDGSPAAAMLGRIADLVQQPALLARDEIPDGIE